MREVILVTGGAGFIGSHVCERYLYEGHEVIIVDDLSSGKLRNIEKIIEHERCTFYHFDIIDLNRLKEVFIKHKPTVINHHAAQKSIVYSVTNPLKDLEINIVGLLNLLTLTKEFSIKNFIYVSSGGALSKELHENEKSKEMDTPMLLSPYAITKFSGESYVKVYGELHSFDYSILRYANIYGPRQLPDGESGVIPIFIQNILANKESILMTYPDMPRGCTRDYVYVDDIVEANVLCLKSTVNEVINLGSGKGEYILDIYNKIQEVFNSNIEIKIQGPRIGDIRRSVLDNKKAREILKWQPTIPLKEGLNKLKLAYSTSIKRVTKTPT